MKNCDGEVIKDIFLKCRNIKKNNLNLHDDLSFLAKRKKIKKSNKLFVI